MRFLSLGLCAFLVAGLLIGCGGEDTTVVDSGTYEGTITEMNPEETEIYVDVPDTGTLELYFTDTTRVMSDDTTEASYEDLETGQEVSVEVERVGQRLDPVTVRILGDNS